MRSFAGTVVFVLICAACGGAADDPVVRDVVEPVAATPTSTTTGSVETTVSTDADVADHEASEPDHEEGSHDIDEDGHEESHDAAGHDEGNDDLTNEDEATGDEAAVHIIMTEFAFEPAVVNVTSGETVRFVVHNEGSIPHEFRLSNAHRIDEHLASGHADHGDGGHHAEDGDVFIELAPGKVGELVVTFPEDTTVFTDIACLIPGHYEAGMLGDVVYT